MLSFSHAQVALLVAVVMVLSALASGCRLYRHLIRCLLGSHDPSAATVAVHAPSAASVPLPGRISWTTRGHRCGTRKALASRRSTKRVGRQLQYKRRRYLPLCGKCCYPREGRRGVGHLHLTEAGRSRIRSSFRYSHERSVFKPPLCGEQRLIDAEVGVEDAPQSFVEFAA